MIEKYSFDELEQGIQAKMETYVFRIALILELVKQATSGEFKGELRIDSLKNAIRVIEYFRVNALKVGEMISNHNPLMKMPQNKQDLYAAMPDEFKREHVIGLCVQYGLKGGSIDRFLGDYRLFQRINGKGEYKKKI